MIQRSATTPLERWMMYGQRALSAVQVVDRPRPSQGGSGGRSVLMSCRQPVWSAVRGTSVERLAPLDQCRYRVRPSVHGNRGLDCRRERGTAQRLLANFAMTMVPSAVANRGAGGLLSPRAASVLTGSGLPAVSVAWSVMTVLPPAGRNSGQRRRSSGCEFPLLRMRGEVCADRLFCEEVDRVVRRGCRG